MPRWMLRACCCLVTWAGAAAAQGLPPEVEAALVAAQLPRDALVVLVAPAEGGAPRLAHRADVAVNPASVAKLATTYAALDLLGPAYAWKTPVWLEGSVRDGVLQGNLVLQGLGDPKLVIERLWLLLRQVQARGVHTIAGDIVLDRGAFAVPPVDPGAFDGEPLRPYNVAPDALLVNYKTVVLTITPDAGGRARVRADPALAGVQWPASVPLAPGECGAWPTALRADFANPLQVRFGGGFPAACGERTWNIAFPDPASYGPRAIAALWQEMGGRLDGVVREGRAPASRPAFEATSPPLAEVVRDVNKYSNNVMARQLFLTLSLQQRGSGTYEGSREVLGTWWRARIGGEPPFTENGSGLSRVESFTARQLGQLLQVAWASPLMPDLVASLPALGLDGTLRRARQNVGLAHLKTGSLANVSGVAGYVHAGQGRRYVLVAIANHPRANEVRPAIQALVDWTARQ